MTAFQVAKTVRFAHCDPAGIVFFPRYLELLNEVVEDWFAGPLQASFRRLHVEERRGTPTVRLEADFAAASRVGDILDFTLEVSTLGAASCALVTAADCGSERRAAFRHTLVHVDLDAMKSRPWPDDLRRRMAAFGVTTA